MNNELEVEPHVKRRLDYYNYKQMAFIIFNFDNSTSKFFLLKFRVGISGINIIGKENLTKNPCPTTIFYKNIAFFHLKIKSQMG